jgi:hypothetical protein
VAMVDRARAGPLAQPPGVGQVEGPGALAATILSAEQTAGQLYQEGCESGRIGRSRKPLSLRAPWVQIPLPPLAPGHSGQGPGARGQGHRRSSQHWPQDEHAHEALDVRGAPEAVQACDSGSRFIDQLQGADFGEVCKVVVVSPVACFLK